MSDFETAARAVLVACRNRGLRLVTAESCTGGMVAAALTSIAGSSDVVDGGFVTYSNEVKQRLLGVKADTLARFGAVSEQVAAQMAEGARTGANSDLAVSATGIAGPGGSEFKPEGRVCFAIAANGAQTQAYTCEFGAIGRAGVRKAATLFALNLLTEAAR